MAASVPGGSVSSGSGSAKCLSPQNSLKEVKKIPNLIFVFLYNISFSVGNSCNAFAGIEESFK